MTNTSQFTFTTEKLNPILHDVFEEGVDIAYKNGRYRFCRCKVGTPEELFELEGVIENLLSDLNTNLLDILIDDFIAINITLRETERLLVTVGDKRVWN